MVVSFLSFSFPLTAGLETRFAVSGADFFEHVLPLGVDFEGSFAAASKTLGTIRCNYTVHVPYSLILTGGASWHANNSCSISRCLLSAFPRPSLVRGLPVVASSDSWSGNVGYCVADSVHEVDEVVQV